MIGSPPESVIDFTGMRTSIRVHWPGGERSEWLDTEVNRRVCIERGLAEPIALEPPPDA